MAANELPGAIGRLVASSNHRQTDQVAAEILGKLLGGRVPALRLLAQRHQNDVVNIARQTPPQPVGAPFAHLTD